MCKGIVSVSLVASVSNTQMGEVVDVAPTPADSSANDPVIPMPSLDMRLGESPICKYGSMPAKGLRGGVSSAIARKVDLILAIKK